ncbi:prepilin peptidase [Halobacillus hunanensis]|uniref:prepilin peptidase n=1 Tax=Halobacillus hunanensis TaxID=578214 RepID=UPI0009A5B929|nr:A24 family peptidase [Halobacillus hunanensis]
MTIVFSFYFLLLGLLFGSFFNVVGLRVPKREFLKRKRSYCPKCLHSLSWFDLIPLISYLLLGARCRYCKQKIPLLYPLMECTSGISFMFSFILLGFQPRLVLALLLLSLLHIIIVSDLNYMIIPDNILVFFFVLLMIYRIFVPSGLWWGFLLGASVGLFGTAMIIMLSRGGMGGGDMKLLGLVGFALGTKLLLVAFFSAIVMGAIVCSVLLRSGLISRHQPFPFGPFIAAGTIISFFYGTKMTEWYINRFFL